MKSYCFIYNPAANPTSSLQQFNRLKELTSDWDETLFLTSQERGDIGTLAREAAKKFDAVIACGGDGTAREVASGLIYTDTPMGVIPMGSGNDFSKSLNIPGVLGKAVEVIRNGLTTKMDMGRCNDIYFINSFGIGFDGLANYYALQSRLKGTLKYAWGALRANMSQEPLLATVWEGEHQYYSGPLLMITVANGKVEGGSFIVAPDARNDDGELDILTVRPVSKWVLPFLLPLFVWGKQNRLKYVHTFRAKNLTIRLDRPAFIHADGEIMERSETDFTVEVLPAVLDVIRNYQAV